ncbi:MAG: CARDB domain-containing protein, partial [Ketobacteraceae bacterium]|nr:CARDB domain-containing protein [Ketobacteraceae bacterium]
LVITDAVTDHECYLLVTLSNRGNGMVDPDIWKNTDQPEVAIERNKKFWSTRTLGVIDPMQILVHPGGHIQYRTSLKAAAQGTENIALVVDRKNRIRESNEQNNRQSYSLSCALPDLVINRLYLDEHCTVTAEIRNTGDAEILAAAYEPNGPDIMLKRNGKTWGAWPLRQIDPQQALQQPGAKITFSTKLKPGSQPEKFQLILDQENRLLEKDEKNNSHNAEFACKG